MEPLYGHDVEPRVHPVCPECGSENTTRFEWALQHWFQYWTCWNCGRPFVVDDDDPDELIVYDIEAVMSEYLKNRYRLSLFNLARYLFNETTLVALISAAIVLLMLYHLYRT